MELQLGRQDLFDGGEKLSGTNISCQHGVCWLTRTGDAHDYILRAGDSFQVQGAGRIVIMAYSDCRLQLRKTAVPLGGGFFRYAAAE